MRDAAHLKPPNGPEIAATLPRSRRGAMTAGELRAAIAKVDDDCLVEVAVYGSLPRDGKVCRVSIINDEIKSVSFGYYASDGHPPAIQPSIQTVFHGYTPLPPLTRGR